MAAWVAAWGWGKSNLDAAAWHARLSVNVAQVVRGRVTSGEGERGRSPYETLALGVCVCENVYYGS